MKEKILRKKKATVLLLFLVFGALSGMIAYYSKTAFFLEPENQISQLLENENKLLEERKKYGIPLAVFEALPHPPADFFPIVRLMHSGQYTNYPFFSEEYYLQPEFYPHFLENALSYWVNPNPGYYGAAGYGFYPPSQEISIHKGEKTVVSFFMRSGYGVQNYQGARIVQKNSVDGINVHITEPDVLLGYTFPKFSPQWAKKTSAVIQTSSDVLPAGRYEIVFAATNPPQEKSLEWQEQLDRQYKDIGFSSIYLNTIIAVNVME